MDCVAGFHLHKPLNEVWRKNTQSWQIWWLLENLSGVSVTQASVVTDVERCKGIRDGDWRVEQQGSHFEKTYD